MNKHYKSYFKNYQTMNKIVNYNNKIFLKKKIEYKYKNKR